MPIVWTDDLNIGVEMIDKQHRKIVDYINALEGAIGEPDQEQRRLSVGQVVIDLIDYTRSHFAFEESLLEGSGYKFSDLHKGVHEVFVTRIAKLQERHEAGVDIAERLHGMLGTWLFHHIKQDDMAYAPDLKACLRDIAQGRRNGDWLNQALEKLLA